jgi:hypothetical protein
LRLGRIDIVLVWHADINHISSDLCATSFGGSRNVNGMLGEAKEWVLWHKNNNGTLYAGMINFTLYLIFFTTNHIELVRHYLKLGFHLLY